MNRSLFQSATMFLVAGVVSVSVVSRQARAQHQPIPRPSNAGQFFGLSLGRFGNGVFGDLDGDGVSDFIVGEPGGGTAPSHYWVISGATLGVISDFSVPGPSGVAAAGDVDGDGDSEVYSVTGVYDALTGASLTPSTAFSGLGGFGTTGSVGDVNGDGRSNIAFLTTRTDPISGASVFGMHVYDGLGPFLYSVPLPASYAKYRLAPIGDIDGDGCEDVVVGAVLSTTFPTWLFDPGYVAIISGQTGTILTTLGAGLGSQFGDSVCGIGDADGDGVPDIVVSAAFGPIWNVPNSLGAQGQIWLISGATLQATAVWDCPLTGLCGAPMYCLEDVDGDGFNEFIILGGLLDPIISSRTFTRIPFPYILQSSTYIGDLDGDGVGEVVTRYGPSVLSLLPESYSIFGHSQAAPAHPDTPVIGISGLAEPAGSVTVNASNVPDGVPAFLMIGGSNTDWGGRGLPFDVSMFGIGGCDVLISPDLIFPTVTTSIGSKAYASLTFPLPNDPALVGLTRYVQWYVTTGGNGPGALSAAVAITF